MGICGSKAQHKEINHQQQHKSKVNSIDIAIQTGTNKQTIEGQQTDPSFKKYEIISDLERRQLTEPFKFDWDVTTLNADKFKVNQSQIERIFDDQESYFITSKQTFPSKGVFSVIFKIIKSSPDQAIYIGLHQEKCKKNEISSEQSIAMYGTSSNRNGGLWMEDDSFIQFQENELGAVEGGQIEMIVDMDQSQIMFIRRKNQKQPEEKITAVSLILNESFSDKKLVVIVGMLKIGESLEVEQ